MEKIWFWWYEVDGNQKSHSQPPERDVFETRRKWWDKLPTSTGADFFHQQ